eukprot:3449054-Pyramimonas_sp.AAC.1
MGRFRALRGASGAILGRSLEPLGPVRADVGLEKGGPGQLLTTMQQSMTFPSWGPLGKPLGGLSGRLGAPLDGLG